MRRAGGLVVVLVLVALVGCSDDGGDERLEGASSCTDPSDDGGGSAAELVSAKLEVDGDDLVVTWQLADAPNADESVLYFAGAYPRSDDDVGYLLGAETDSAGAPVRAWVFEERNEYVPLGSSFDTATSSFTARFPVDELDRLDAPFGWYAAVNVDETDVDGCPALHGEKMTTFP